MKVVTINMEGGVFTGILRSTYIFASPLLLRQLAKSSSHVVRAFRSGDMDQG